MRQVILDTETTGLEWDLGHRVIEVGCIELLGRRVTEKRFHKFVNPERPIDHGALEVHGISAESLLGKPKFSEIADELLEFITGSELVIHNADFDIGFLNNELSLTGRNLGRIEDVCSVQDTLQLARQLHPGQRNNLDALCKYAGWYVATSGIPKGSYEWRTPRNFPIGKELFRRDWAANLPSAIINRGLIN